MKFLTFFHTFLNEIKLRRFKSLVQTLTTLPNFISWVLVYSIAFSLFSNSGMLNTYLQNEGFSKLAKITRVEITDEIPLLGSGKVNYRELKNKI